MDELFGISDGEDDAPKQQPQVCSPPVLASAPSQNCHSFVRYLSGVLSLAFAQQEEGAAGEDDDVAQERAAQKNSVRRRATGEPLHVELPVPAAKSAREAFSFPHPNPRTDERPLLKANAMRPGVRSFAL